MLKRDVTDDANLVCGCFVFVWVVGWTALIIWAIVSLVNHFTR